VKAVEKDLQDQERPPALSPRSQLLFVGALGLLTLIGIGLFLFLESGSGAPAPQPANIPHMVLFSPTREQRATLQFETVGRRVFHTEIATDGYVAANGGFAAAGASNAAIANGMPVLAGQSSDTIQAESDLVTASAQLRAATENEKRQHDLYESEGAALKDWQQAQVDLASAAAALSSARNRLRMLGKSDTAIAGLETSAPRGGAAAFSVGELSTVWLVANVREIDAGLVHLGDAAEVRLPACPGQVFNAVIDYAASVIDPVTHRLVIAARIRNPDGLLKPNMLANFIILAGKATNAPAVPERAIIYEGDSRRVWVVDAKGNLILRSISVGRSSAGYAEITSGLAAGERVVTGGALFIDQAASSG
jgi:cobalt-zinc-cadmium efflux system membrane fusion protein